jgi:restriction system protein
MARKKSSPAEDLMDVVAMLPWWLGVALAIVAYVVLHQLASQPLPTAAKPSEAAALLTQSVWRALAQLGQYVLPLLCLAGAGMSAWRRRGRTQLLDRATHNEAANALQGISWQQFEQLVGEGFRRQGYRVLETGGGGADGGVDLVLNRDGETHLVQCKQWRAQRVGVEVVRELYGVMAAKGAAGGFVVTSGRYTDAARSFASGRNVRLIDGPQLRALLQQVQGAPSPRAAQPAPSATALASPANSPACPVCSSAMVRRTAKRGAAAGQAFWGCSAYPSCRGTRAMDEPG